MEEAEAGVGVAIGGGDEQLRAALEPASLSLGNSHAHHNINSVHDNEAQ